MNWTGAGFAVIVFGLLVFLIVNNRLTKYFDILNPRQAATNAFNITGIGAPFNPLAPVAPGFTMRKFMFGF